MSAAAPTEPNAPTRPEGEAPGPRWGAMVGWSVLMLAISLAVAALALPVLHWLGFDPK